MRAAIAISRALNDSITRCREISINVLSSGGAHKKQIIASRAAGMAGRRAWHQHQQRIAASGYRKRHHVASSAIKIISRRDVDGGRICAAFLNKRQATQIWQRGGGSSAPGWRALGVAFAVFSTSRRYKTSPAVSSGCWASRIKYDGPSAQWALRTCRGHPRLGQSYAEHEERKKTVNENRAA